MKWALVYLLISGNWGAVGTFDSGLRYDTYAICEEKAKEFAQQVSGMKKNRLKTFRCLPSTPTK